MNRIVSEKEPSLNVKAAVTIVENRKDMAMLETTPHFDVMLNGVWYFKLYFNMTGYSGYLPLPPRADSENQRRAVPLSVGEGGISRYRKELPRLNREWAAWHAAGNAPLTGVECAY